jgi:hypothetical protein
LVHIRFVAAAALAASLAGCSFFDSSDYSARYRESGGPGAARPAQSVQLAALPGYLSDEDIAPARPVGSGLGLLPAVPRLLQAVPRKPSGFVGIPSRRPAPTAALAPVRPALAPARVSQPRRVLTFADFVPPRPLRELQPMGTPLRAESYTLADLVEDQAWRQRTSQQLERLFQ